MNKFVLFSDIPICFERSCAPWFGKVLDMILCICPKAFYVSTSLRWQHHLNFQFNSLSRNNYTWIFSTWLFVSSPHITQAWSFHAWKLFVNFFKTKGHAMVKILFPAASQKDRAWGLKEEDANLKYQRP